MLPIYFQPHQDELLYSWIDRLAKANELSRSAMIGKYLGRPTASARSGRIPYDIRNEFQYFYQHLFYKPNMKELFVKTSTFPFEALFLKEKVQARYIEYVFYPLDKFTTRVDALFKKPKICDECVQEDIEKLGVPYLRRSHQLTGVCTCHKHGSLLKEFNGGSGDAADYDFSQYVLCQPSASMESERAYTAYAQTLFEANLNSSLERIRAVVLEQLKNRNFDDLRQGWRYNDLLPQDFDHDALINKIKQKISMSAREYLPVLMLLFPDVQECCSILRESDEIILERVCQKCGTSYCTTKITESVGRGCPKCDLKLSDQERYEKYVRTVSDGDYEVIGNFVAMPKKITHRHVVCGREFNVSPEGFLYTGVRCKCETTITEDVAKRTIESFEGFHMIKYDEGVGHKITIHHDGCGLDFLCFYKSFLTYPTCRHCQTALTMPYSKKLENVVGDEFQLVSEYKGERTPVQFRHKVCGGVFSYEPSKFLQNPRCQVCDNRDQRIWRGWFESLVRYRNENGTANIPKTESYEDRKLGDWCERQRAKWRKGKLPPYNKALLDSIGFEWEPNRLSWDTQFKLYIECKEELGKVGNDTVYQGVNIGSWAQTQRSLYKNGTISADRLEKLNAIGFDWEPKAPRDEDGWLQKYNLYVEYVSQIGPVVQNTRYKEVNIGTWANIQRIAFRAGKLGDDRFALLEAVDFDFVSQKEKNDSSWDDQYNLYIEYVSKKGPVMQKTVYNGVRIGQWASRQKRDYWAGKLSNDRIEKLDAIGFDWTLKHEKDQEIWDEKYNIYAEYVSKMGQITRHNTIYKGVNIDDWARKQRAAYREGKLSEDKIARLNDIGFEWEPKGLVVGKWEMKCALYAECFKERGEVPTTTEYKDVPIGYWIRRQRTQHRNGTLDPEHEAALRKINPHFFD